jgi:hypothetical protein
MLAPRVNQGGAAPLLMMRHASLRRHYPHQVRRVFLTRLEAFIKPARTPNVWRSNYWIYAIIASSDARRQ